MTTIRTALDAPVDTSLPDGTAIGTGDTDETNVSRLTAIRAALRRGLAGRPRWEWVSLGTLLVATAVLYLWGLGASGWANSYYSAAVQAMSTSWKAFLFGASDAAGSITVDKSPGSLWPMALSVRIFGLSSWSILVPQALMGVASVGVLYATIRRWFGPVAALIAGAVAATTPVAVLMFRFNNPDALLVLALVVAAWATTRAVEDGRLRWMLAAGAAIGVGFLSKEPQAFVLLPVLAGTYAIAGPPKLGRRVLHVAAMGAATVVSAGWWVLLVTLWPASSRPYIGGSQDNTFLDVLLGYNGLGRLTGDETGSVGGGGGGNAGGNWGPTGITRMFNDSFGSQASWLIPAALLLLVAGLVHTLRRPRTDRTRAAFLLWGGWLVLTGLVFSLSAGIIHEYYTVALAPAIGALVGIGGAGLWRRREEPLARNLLAGVVVLSAGWSFMLLDRQADWLPWLRWVVLGAGVVAALALVARPLLGSGPLPRSTQTAVAALAVVAALGGPVAWGVATAATPHTGSIPLAGPSGSSGGPGGGMGGGMGGAMRGGTPPSLGGVTAPGGTNSSNNSNSTASNSTSAGGLLQGSVPGDELTALLEAAEADGYDWVAATVGANSASGYQLAAEASVMPIGGFNGTDPSPTLEQFQQWVEQGRIRYFIAGGGMGGGPGGGMGGGPAMGSSGTSSAISEWVSSTFSSTTVDGVTLYDLTDPL